MSNISDYTSVFRVRLGETAGGSGDSGDYTQQHRSQLSDTSSSSAHISNAGPPIRRSQLRTKSRPVVSCHLCRARKQKCDRLLPCGTCARRGDGALCRYGGEGGVVSVSAGAASTAAASGGGGGGSMTSASIGGGAATTGMGFGSGTGGGSLGGHGRRPSLSAAAAAAAAAAARASAGGATGSTLGVRQEAQMRLQRLEEMVNGLVARTSTSDDPTTEKVGETAVLAAPLSLDDLVAQAPPKGPQKAGRDLGADRRFAWEVPIGSNAPPSSIGPVASMLGQTPFAGATNWAAVLDSIRDIQSYLGEAGAGDGAGEGEGGREGGCGEDANDDTGEAGAEVNQRHASSPPFHTFNSRPRVYNEATDVDSIILPTSLGPMPRLPDATPTEQSASTQASSPISRRDALPPHSSFEASEPDGIFVTVAVPHGLTNCNQSIPPATSTSALHSPLPKHLADAVAALPPRSDCDRLLAVYFQSSYVTGPFVHMGQFQRAYSRFWQTGNPASANPVSPLLWISMLASILSIGAMISGSRQLAWMADRDPDTSHSNGGSCRGNRTIGCGTACGKRSKEEEAELKNEDLALGDRIRKLSMRCLLAGDYLAGRPLAIEALLLNIQARMMQKRDPDPTLWATFSVVVRLAQRMGYQQVDAPRGGVCGIGGRPLTPFEKEVRRRVWFFVESFDMLYSFQFGMPTIIHEDETATDPPNNLRDDDFDENTVELPPSRAPADYTPALYFSVKLNLIRLMRKVLRFAVWPANKPDSRDASSYKATISKLTNELRWAYSTVPPRLRMPMHIRDCPFSDATYDIMHRLAIELMHHKAVCILFRESLSRDTSDGSHGDGDDGGFTAQETEAQRQACLVSALRILDLHTEFEYETRPASTAATTVRSPGTIPHESNRGAGRLATDRYMLSSLALHDFLLAATLLCLDLIEGGRHERSSKSSKSSKSSGTPASTSEVPTSTKNLSLPPSLTFAPFLGGGESTLEERAADRGAKLEALRTTYALWHERRLTSRDAAHAARILGAIVTRLVVEVGGEQGARNGQHDGKDEVADNGESGSDSRPTAENPDWGYMAQMAQREQILQEAHKRAQAEQARRTGQAEQDSQTDATETAGTTTQDNTPPWHTTADGMPDAPSMTQPPPPHLNYAYEWADPGPFGAVLNDPMNVDWSMVDLFLLDRQFDTDVGGNVWSADLMALEN